MSNVFGIAGGDLVSFADTAQRVTSLGVPLEDFVQAMSKAGGPLKAVGAQGLKVANDMAPLVALLTQAGIGADEAGTGIKTLITEFAKAGKFTTIPNMVKDLEKLHRLNPQKLMSMFENSFGKEHSSKALIIAAGGYDQLALKMSDMADMAMKIGSQLTGLTSIIDSMTGTIQNAGAAFGSVYAPEIKAVAESTNISAEAIRGWIGENGPAVMMAVKMAGAFVGLKVAAWGLAGGIGAITTAMKLNPLMWLAQAAIVAAPLIIDNWDSIVGGFEKGISKIKNFFQPLIDMLNFISEWVTNNPLLKLVGSVPLFLGKSVASLLPDFSGFQLPIGEGMRPPGHEKSIIKPLKGGVDVNVRFDNSPATMRVSPTVTRGPVRSTVDVGYRFNHAMNLGM